MLRVWQATLLLAAGEDLGPACRKGGILESLPGVGLLLYGGKGVQNTEHLTRKGHLKVEPKVGILGDTWLYDLDLGSWRARGGNATCPAARWKAGGIDVGGGRYVLFGGDTSEDVEDVQSDLWIYDAGTGWHRVEAGNAPAPRRGHLVVRNSSHLVVLGGKVYGPEGEACSKDSWALPLAALAPGATASSWTQGVEFPGECRWGGTGTVILDQAGKEFLAMFGGRLKTKEEGSEEGYKYFDELWLHDFESGTWSLRPKKGVHPAGRDHHGAARIGKDLYIFGGRDDPKRKAHADRNDVWKFSLADGWTALWSPHQNGPQPSKRFMPGVTAVESWEGGPPALFVFGGEALPATTKTGTMNDLWAFTESGWQELHPNDCTATPTVEASQGLAWPAIAGMILTFVGVGGVMLWRRSRAADARAPHENLFIRLD